MMIREIFLARRSETDDNRSSRVPVPSGSYWCPHPLLLPLRCATRRCVVRYLKWHTRAVASSVNYVVAMAPRTQHEYQGRACLCAPSLRVPVSPLGSRAPDRNESMTSEHCKLEATCGSSP